MPVKVIPNYTGALIGKGFALHQLGSNNEAIIYYDKALAIGHIDADTLTDTLTNKGAALAALQKYSEAIKYYDQALAIKPNLQDAINGKCISLEALNQTQIK
jgi:protein O-GlcNAc transferase